MMMDLTVKLLSGERRVVHLSASSTVGDLRREVSQVFNASASRMRLSTDSGRHLTVDAEHAPLQSLGLHAGSTVMVVLEARENLQVFVRNEKGQVKTYDVSEEETVAQLQQKIYKKEWTPTDQQRLVYGGRQLEPASRLRDYGIEQGSTINMTLRLRGGYWETLGATPTLLTRSLDHKSP